MIDIKPLRILNTRPFGQNQHLSQAIQRAGGHVIELPALIIEPTAHTWLSTLPQQVHQNIFISRNAVHFFFKTIDQNNWTLPCDSLVLAIGQATTQALNQYGIDDVRQPSQADSEHLLALESLQHIADQTILLVKGEQGRDLIETTLKARDANLVTVEVYRRRMPNYDQQYIDSLWHEDAVDIILLTSEQALHHLFDLFRKEARPWLCHKRYVVFSARLAAIATTFGIKHVIQSRYDNIEDTLQGLINEHHSS